MPLTEKKLVCMICLKRFTLNENDTENLTDSTAKTTGPKAWSIGCSEPLSREKKTNSSTLYCDSNDLYERFLQFVSRYFKLTTLTDQFLECAKEVKSENDERAILQTFCDSCGHVVSQVCNLYNDLKTIQLFLVWKLREVGDILKSSSRPMTKNSSRKLMSSVAKQMNIKAGSSRRLLTFRKSLQLKCFNAARKNDPYVAIRKEDIPNKWNCKFSYNATKQALIKLITVFTLSSSQLSSTIINRTSCTTTEVTEDANQSQNRRRPGRRPRRNNVKPVQETPENRSNQTAGENDVPSDAAAACRGAEDNDETPNNFENDWSYDAPPSPLTPAASDEDESQTRFNLRQRRNILVKAEEDGGETSSEESDTDDHEEFKTHKKSTRTQQREAHLHFKKLGPKPIKSKCLKCSQLFPSRLEFWQHMKQVHQYQRPTNRLYRRDPQTGWPSKSPQKAEIKCPQCPKLLVDLSGLSSHLHRFHHTESQYPCSQCGMVFTRYMARRAHERKLHKFYGAPVPVQTSCPNCSQVFPSRFEMWRHCRMTHKTEYKVHQKINGGRHRKPGVKPTPSDCPKCSENFPSRTELNRHLKIAHINELEIEIPRKKKRSFKPGPKSIPSDCSKCSETFPSRTELYRHIAQMHMKKPEEAPCDEVIKLEVDHDDGMQEHEAEESEQLEMESINQLSKSGKKAEIKCPHCPKLLVDRRGLSSHLQSTHRSYIEYPCKECGMRFKKHLLLRRHHKKMHAYKRGGRCVSSTCSKCSEVFPSRTELWWHHKKEHKLYRGVQPISSTCPKCSQVFPSRTELMLHQTKTHGLHRYHHAKPVESTCTKCSEVFPSKKKMSTHMKIVHRQNIYYFGKPPGRPKVDEKELKGINEQFICEVEKCGESFELASLLRKHLEMVHEAKKSTKGISCCHCCIVGRKQFAYRQTYEMHMRTSHKIKIFGTYKCDVEACKVKSFRSVDELNEHLKSHLEEPKSGIYEILFCEKCNWGFSRPELRDLHQLAHISLGDDGKIDCPQCSGRYGPDVKYLQAHFNKVHGLNLKPLKCDQCEKGFFLQGVLSKHKSNMHKNCGLLGSEERYRCKVCGTAHLDKILLKEHMICQHPMLSKDLDSRQRDWCCELCGAGFTNRYRLNIHMIRHEDPKFSCDICGALFKFKNKLNDHKKYMHDPDRSKTFICSECGKGFYSDIGLQFHFDSAHKPESEWHLKCHKCPSRFYRKLYLGIHLKTCDGSEEEEKRRVENEMMSNEKVGTKLPTRSPEAQQNEFRGDLSSLSISQLLPNFQSDPILFDAQHLMSTEILPEVPELREITLSTLPPQNPQIGNQDLVAEETHDMRNSPLNKAIVGSGDQLKFEVVKESNDLIENDDDQTPEPDNIETGNDSDWSRGGTSPMSIGTVSSNEDFDYEKDESQGNATWNLRKRRSAVVKVEEDKKDDESSHEIDDLGEDPFLHTPTPPPELEKSKTSTSHHKLKMPSKLCPVVAIERIKKVEEMVKNNPKLRKARPKVTRSPRKRTIERVKNIECPHCPQKFTFQHTYKLHLRFKHNHENKAVNPRRRKAKLVRRAKYKCDFESCEKRAFHSMETLNNHLKTHVKPGESEIMFCEICNWGFMRKELKEIHQLVHIPVNEKGQIPCNQCRVSYTNIGYLQVHFNKEHGLNLKFHKCDECDEGFFFKHSLMYHRRTHHNQRRNSDLKCEECKMTFENATLFGKHIQNCHDPGQRFTCSEPGCELKFSTRRKLHTHKTLKHVGNEGRHWICDLCGAQFTTKTTLEKHVENHEVAKWPCEICGLKFKRRDRVKEHIDRIHNPGRQQNWICSECGKSYFTEMGLQYHFDSAHKKESEWALKCSKCPRRFYRKLFLDLHSKKCNGSQVQNEDKADKETAGSEQKGSLYIETEKETSSKPMATGQLEENKSENLLIRQPPNSQCNPGKFSSQPTASPTPVFFQSSASQVVTGTAPGFQGLPDSAFSGVLAQYQHQLDYQMPSRMQLYQHPYNEVLQFDTGNSPPGRLEYHSPSSSSP